MKKLLALLLIAMLAVSMLASCGSTSTSTDASTGETSDAPIQLNIAGRIIDTYTSLDDVEYLNMIEEQTNIDIVWTEWAASVLSEKRNLALASGQLPDAMWGTWVLDNADVTKNGDIGVLLDLTDYITEEYMPNFYALTQQYPEIIPSISTPTGEIYGLPAYGVQEYEITNDTMLINTVWLEELGLEMPTTTDELFDAMMAFKAAGDMNGNGQNDEQAFAFRYNDGNSGAYGLIGMTGMNYCDQHYRMDRNADGEIVFVPGTEEYKVYLKFMNKLYENGLIDPESFTYDTTTYNAKTQTPTPSIFVFSSWSAANVNNAIEGNDQMADGVYQYLPPITNSETGETPVWCMRYRAPGATTSLVVNSQISDEKLVALLRWADAQYDRYNSFVSTTGIEGIHWEMVSGDKENGFEYQSLYKEDGSKYTSDELSAYVPIAGLYYNTPDYAKNVTVATAQGKEKAAEVYGEYVNRDQVITSARQTEEESVDLPILMADMRDYVDMMVASFITEGNIDERWDEYQKGLKGIQIDRFVELITAIDARS